MFIKLTLIGKLETDREYIAALAAEREEENISFRSFLKGIDGQELDKIAHAINETVTAAIDCTSCGACCRSLMINIEEDEIRPAAIAAGVSPEQFKGSFIEVSSQGKMIMNTIPCHFLTDNKCSIYSSRFSECREFPHLHKPNFKGRLFGTMMHYAMCPIVFNVVEELKGVTGFKRG